MWLWNFKLREGSFPAVAAVVCGVQWWCGVLISLQYYIKRESSAPAAADGSPLHCAFSWHKLCRIPLELGDTVETWTLSGDLLKTWTLARDWEETCWRPGDWVETCHVHEQSSRCGAVVAAWSWQPASSPPPTINRKLSYSWCLLSAHLSLGTQSGNQHIHFLFSLTYPFISYNFDTTLGILKHLDTKSQINKHSNLWLILYQ